MNIHPRMGGAHCFRQARTEEKEITALNSVRWCVVDHYMASFYRSTVQEFLSHQDEQVLAHLNVGYANRGYAVQYSHQTLTWQRDLSSLRRALQECVNRSGAAPAWGLLLEFSIPRKERRIDVVLLIGAKVVILEAKTEQVAAAARRQIEEYALLLQYFHKGSADRRVFPIIVSDSLSLEDGLDANWESVRYLPRTSDVSEVIASSWRDLPSKLLPLEEFPDSQISPTTWDDAPYFPVPSIFEAALALRSGLSIREIAHSEASEHEIDKVQHAIQAIVDQARIYQEHVICFLTGVPGSGKTLVGLALAHSTNNQSDAIHFMSGNGPLVKVLQHLFVRESMRGGARSAQAQIEAKTLIENVHVFARYYTDDHHGAPSNHAVIFDEAQRAWNRTQNKRKFKRDYSEPEMLLRVMERHADWAVIIALVGGGQEINDGEAGLEEWGRALVASSKDWKVYASPEVIHGGTSTAGRRLFSDPVAAKEVHSRATLHLRTSNRSLRAERLAEWVNLVLDGDDRRAAALAIGRKFPILLSRNLSETRAILRLHGIGGSRYGLVGSSAAARLRAEGLEPSSSFHSDYPWEHWYLAENTDIRSSFQCEVFATEFEIQGLELDWVGLCWGGDFIWDNAARCWLLRSLRHGPRSTWTPIRSLDKQKYRRNAYRVLLTRARQGMTIFVPRGDLHDPTISSAEFQETADFLIRCGATPVADETCGAAGGCE